MTNSAQRPGFISGAENATLMLVVVLVLGLVAIQPAGAQNFTDLYNFTGPPDGEYPYNVSLVRDAAGNLYGTTAGGGTGPCSGLGLSGCGTVFEVNASGTETVLYSFCPQSGCADGQWPFAGLVRDAAGNLYGTTYEGGASGYGTVFELTPQQGGGWTEAVLHSFAGPPNDGSGPWASLVLDTSGNLYGTTWQGGSFSTLGTVFKVSKTGKETVLHSFSGSPNDGANPRFGSLVMDKVGNLYGVTSSGGVTPGNGTVFKMNTTGAETVLYSFCPQSGCSDGQTPYGSPAMDRQGNLYGTTEYGGSFGDGVVWKLSKNGTETVLHNFAGGPSDGANPVAGVIIDAKGDLYGESYEGGSSGDGAAYKLNKKGRLTLLHSFAGPDGTNPLGGVIRDASGNLYGTAYEGGSDGYGTVWKLTP